MTTLNADRWLHTQLTTDSQLATALGGRIYIDIAPQDTQYPLAIMTFVTARQVSNMSADRVMDDELWQIEIWTDKPSYTELESIADRIRKTLHKASGAGVVGCAFERQLPRMSDPEGYKAIILEFRLFTQ